MEERQHQVRRTWTAALLLVCALLVASCGGDAPSQARPSEVPGASVARTAPLLGDAAGIMASPGGAMAKPVYQCNAFTERGATSIAMRAVFHDVTSRGWGCAEARRRVLTVFSRWRGQRRPFRSGRLACYRLYTEASYSTIRCWSVDFNAIRFTVLSSARMKRITPYVPRPSDLTRGRGPAVLCGAFRTYFDIATRGITCAQASDVIRRHGDRWDHPRIGRWIRAGSGIVCILIYAEGDQPTYRCIDRRGHSIRFTRSNEPVSGIIAYGRPATPPAAHARVEGATHLVVDHESGAVTVNGTRLPARLSAKAWIAAPASSDLAVAPEISVQCPAFTAWHHVVAIGIACDEVARILPAKPSRIPNNWQVEGLTCMWVDAALRCASSTGYQGFAAYDVSRGTDANVSDASSTSD